ncbi:MAG: hypothetical protein A3G33_02450 [Omnitrophica bacterium RIFCSPLOWO2_12_FULL_44_17]|uniref:PABS domain-containing protein n=1 Tax=Candidatus Danuiimicrobium aquiferis TaxID=1801832 RepID=A0A1G1KVX2_9BACT|nr:MAG: hypothetical protein A3B72_00340 [Omnitrophica bacterium RIFCSPHIGHO2_02_FULL_45_28]OGW97124.1 MAG: hypothetical protein A3G33_02450 [Omnitrophica bacterium RIFCSPLOWO2_12_FULL_44_17]OGX03884.1 MAG: hypothetical protein A3J12_02365 [Omnitrophica bacterium RIFCSPLOWO2_02_FULL_44_11]
MGINLRDKNKTNKHSFLFLLLVLGAQTMIVELAIPRLLAPAFGNTLFCWTAIIGVVMVALTVGYQLGGLATTRKNVKQLILILATLSATWVLGLSLAGEKITSLLSGFGLMFGPLVAATVMAVLPAGFSAAVVPLVVETRTASSGKAAGECYAWSTVGSIIGVLLTGYVLLPQLGIKGAMIVGASAVFFALFLNGGKYVLVIAALFILLNFIFSPRANSSVLLDRNNGYHRIRIVELPGDLKMRTLYLDSTVEGGVKMGDVEPILKYQKRIGEIAQTIPGFSSAFFLGGGSFSMPRYLKSVYPNVQMDVAEIDPDVEKAARTFLELDRKIHVMIGDGRQVLRSQNASYDLIVNDAFHGVREIPFHLITREFNHLVKTKLSTRGIYAINVIGYGFQSELVSGVTRTLKEDFQYVTFFSAAVKSVKNIWILASESPLSLGDKAMEPGTKGKLLTDNCAPVDFLIAKDLARISHR